MTAAMAVDACSAASFRRGAAYELEARTLAALRDALLPKMVSGELAVKAVERFVENLG